MKKVFILLMALPVIVAAQNESGIQFENKLSWSQVKEKAATENKYIFVDVFATWCGPCKQMDKDVYPNDTVGDFMNDKFISVKVQMDSTPHDNDNVKKWYADAQKINKEYPIGGYPTFLFLSPDGQLVHKGMGFNNAQAFVNMAKFAFNPERKQYLTKIQEYKSGKKDYAAMPGLVKTSRDLVGDEKLSKAIAEDYKKNYLDKLSKEKLCTKENLQFINDNKYLIKSSNDPFIDVFLHQSEKADKLLNEKDASKKFILAVAPKIEIYDKIYPNNKWVTKVPDWNALYSGIAKRYNKAYAKEMVDAAKINYYKWTFRWKEFAKLRDQDIQAHPPQKVKDGYSLFDPHASWMLNVDAWFVFERCDDKAVLERALAWSELAISLEDDAANIQVYDTKANILYKLGRVEEAIATEEKAIEIGKALAKKNGQDKGYYFDEYTEIIRKMKKGEPTWIVK